MTILLIILGSLAVAGVAAALVQIGRDGYGHRPTHRSESMPAGPRLREHA